ncbi:MAG: pyridine nucleotide-disulfide oxidoreductase [Chloroflexi bacterium HGW-Chloroflexi-3]|nr:MAG: pyridine nucleotide-disulfide oxidoreductase [Chloroflexi bacterium HGW-Chloroflexi-3]
MRIENKPGYDRKLQRGKRIQITVNQKSIFAYEGELLSTILHCEGIRVLQRKHRNGKASGIYCGMGICYECLVKVNGVPSIRACQTQVVEGMVISTDIVEQS